MDNLVGIEIVKQNSSLLIAECRHKMGFKLLEVIVLCAVVVHELHSVSVES